MIHFVQSLHKNIYPVIYLYSCLYCRFVALCIMIRFLLVRVHEAIQNSISAATEYPWLFRMKLNRCRTHFLHSFMPLQHLEWDNQGIAGEISVHSRMKDMNVTIIRRGGHQWVLGMEIQRTDSLFVKL